MSEEIEAALRAEQELWRDELISQFARSGQEALARIASEHAPDVIVCDLSMPNVNSIELYRRAVESDGCYGRRFVFLTLPGAGDYVAEFLRSVPCRVLYHPFEFARLLSAIRYAAAEPPTAVGARNAQRRSSPAR